jgi:selenocysteine-specific elongation factor
MPIVGTAGHVDHGKSTLVEVLTGRDPDRWAEEKERGLTIDLGFAWTEIDGVEIGFVDVPGHERFIKNMLAGVVGVDCALLVVAADSGWMPQTEEHVRVLNLIGAPTGVIAVTRTDLVDDDTLELAALEILEETSGTDLEGWPVVPVSAVTGVGVDDLRAALVSAVGSGLVTDDGPFRMWVDRAFSIHGSGVIVTGTVQQGSLRIGEDIELQPLGIVSRVRGLHHHDAETETVRSGQRAAVNLGGVDVADIGRGVLLAEPGTSDSTRRMLVSAEPSRGFGEIPDRGAFHIHTGTASSTAQIRRVNEAVYILSLDHGVPATIGDRYLIRERGRQAVVGGGIVIDTQPEQNIDRDRAAGYAAEFDPEQAPDLLVRFHGSADLGYLRRATGGREPRSASVIGDSAYSAPFLEDVASRALPIVAKYHEDHPKRPGPANAELASQVGVDRAVVDHVVSASPDLAETAGSVHLASFSHELTDADEAAWKRARMTIEESLDVPRTSQFPIDVELVHALLRRGDLVQIEPDLAFTDTQIDRILHRVAELSDGFTVSEFKDHFGMSRRQAVPLLEWLDKQGVTLRNGDGRIVRDRSG